MNLDRFTDLLLEGGAAVGDVSRVSKENVDPTIEAFDREVLSQLGITNFTKIGSTGKKSSSGDLDIAVELPEDLDYKEVHSQIQQMGYEVSKASPTTISVKFPIYNNEGKTEEWAQVDLMFGKKDWLEFGYYAPGEGESKYTGAHRNFLLAAIIRYARELKGKEGKTWAIDLNRGLNRKTRGTKVTKTGKEKEVVLAKTLITQRPEKVVDLLNVATDGDWELSDLKAPFEHLWQKTKEAFSEDVLNKIREYVSGASKSSKKEEPVMEQLLRKLTEEVLDEGTSMREKYYLKKTNGEDLYKIYQFLREKLIKELGTPNNTKTHEHLRITFPDKYDADKLEKFVRSLSTKSLDLNIDFNFNNLKVEMINPKNTDPDSPKPTETFSGKYPTYKIHNREGFFFYITDSNEEGKLKQNMADPSGIGLELKSFETFSDSISAVERGVDKIGKRYQEAKDFMFNLLDNVSSVGSSKPYKLSFDEEKEEKASKHLEIIYKDFGEILAALIYQKNVGGVLHFPKGNEPVIDFKLDEIEYSVKHEKGAAGTTGEIINKYGGVKEIINKLKEEDISIDESERFKFVLETIADGSNNNSTINIKIAGELYEDVYKHFKEFMGDENLDYKKFNKGNVKDIIDERFEEIRNNENLDLEEEIKKFHDKLKFKPRNKISNMLDNKNAYGLITYAISARVASRLNKDNDLIEKWKRTLNNLYKTYQVRISVEGSTITFEEKAFNDIEEKDVEFVPGGSSGSPEHQKLRATYE